MQGFSALRFVKIASQILSYIIFIMYIGLCFPRQIFTLRQSRMEAVKIAYILRKFIMSLTLCYRMVKSKIRLRAEMVKRAEMT